MPQKQTEPDKMALWNSVCETLPGWTTKVQYGKRKFTTTCAQKQLKLATKLWGPYGILWGIRNSEMDYIHNGAGDPVEVLFTAEFYYPGGAFEIATDMGFTRDNDTAKKLRTDARSKALSTLGFNSDIFEGLFDDDKYVAEMRAKEKAAKTGEPAPPSPPEREEMPAEELPYEEPPRATEDQLRELRAYMANGTLNEEREAKTLAPRNLKDITELTRYEAANAILACKKVKKREM